MTKPTRRSVRSGFLFGAVVLILAGWVESHGWVPEPKSVIVTDLAVGCLLLLSWIGWEAYARFGRKGRDT